MGKDIKVIKAKEARELADSSDFTLRHIYKVIRERAEENGTSIEWCTYGLSEFALQVVIDHLEANGFKTKVTDEALTIKW